MRYAQYKLFLHMGQEFPHLLPVLENSNVRQVACRVTASNFRQYTMPNKLQNIIKTVIGCYKTVSSDALKWRGGEKSALTEYVKEQRKGDKSVSVGPKLKLGLFALY